MVKDLKVSSQARLLSTGDRITIFNTVKSNLLPYETKVTYTGVATLVALRLGATVEPTFINTVNASLQVLGITNIDRN